MRAWAFLFLVAILAGCTRGGSGDAPTGSAATALAGSALKPNAKGARAAEAARDAVVLDFLAKESQCTFGHRGVLLDLGDPSTRARMSGSHLTASPSSDLEVREHEGASWVGVRSRSLELSFVSSTELKADAGIVIEARVRGGLSRSASVYLNSKPIGTLPFTKGETTIVSTRAQGLVSKGTNELLLHFNGGPRSSHDQLAEIDWIRVGPNDGEAPYSAPTRSDAITTVSIGGARPSSGDPSSQATPAVAAVPRRSISLRAPGFARCTAFIPNGSMLDGFIGVTAGGEAEAEVRVLVDRAEPRVVGSFHLGGPTDPHGWRPVSLPLGDIGTIGAIEIVAKSSSKGARVAFAEPRVLPAMPAEAIDPAKLAAESAPPKARGVILVVLGSTSRRMLSLHGGSTAMPELSNLANGAGGVVFEAHRATSSYATGALGSMLTGVSPREHGASDADAALSSSVFTVAEAARQAGVVTAMFTGNPTTTAPYGFSRGWETFVSRLPGEEAPATALFEDVRRWLDGHKDDRFFLVIHARGGHPPWDMTSEELKELPPTGYAGSLEPKSAGEALAKARKAGGGRLFADPDRERAFALHSKALVAHDVALGALVSHVRTLGREKDTVWIATGDIGIDAAARVPFLEEETLEEGALAVPLVIRAPDSRGATQRVTTATSGVDIAPTILEALALPPPTQLRGESLWTIAAHSQKKSHSAERPLLASTKTRLSARWGAFALTGVRDREVKVCNLLLDPDCVSDVRPSHPLAAEALHALAWNELALIAAAREQGSGSTSASAAAGKTASPTAPAAPAPPTAALDGKKVIADGPTSAALRVWGR
jgi:arylsulfatase A-like enzyme